MLAWALVGNVAADSSGVYICISIVNYLRQGNFICKSEGIYLAVLLAEAWVTSDSGRYVGSGCPRAPW